MYVKLPKLLSFASRAAADLAPTDVLISLLYFGLGALLRAALRAAGLPV